MIRDGACPDSESLEQIRLITQVVGKNNYSSNYSPEDNFDASSSSLKDFSDVHQNATLLDH